MTKHHARSKILVSAPEIAQDFGISKSCAHRMIKSGMIGPCISLNVIGRRKHIRVKRSDYEAYKKNLEVEKDLLPFD